MSEYDTEERDTGVPDRVKEWIDARMQNAGTSIYRGGLAVLSSGFGKGLLITAVLATLSIVAAAVLAPEVLCLGGGLTVAQSINAGLIVAGKFLLGHPGGLAILAAGGATGSLAEAHAENTRISKEAAESQAALYAKLRSCEGKAATVGKDVSFNQDVPGGNCARLMREQPHAQQGQAR